MKNIKYLLIILILCIAFTGCTTGSYTVTKGNFQNSPNGMSMVYECLNGHQQTKINLKDDETIKVNINIITEKGSIDVFIAKDNDTNNYTYKGSDIKTSSFSVELTEPGTYTLRLDAKEHSGSYSFKWEQS